MKIERYPRTGPRPRWVWRTRLLSLEMYPTWSRWGLPFLARDVSDRACGACIPVQGRSIAAAFWGLGK